MGEKMKPEKPLKKSAKLNPNGLVVVCLLLLLSGCAMPVFIRDARLLEDCGEPVMVDDTEGALLRLALEQRDALLKCTEQKRALRAKF